MLELKGGCWRTGLDQLGVSEALTHPQALAASEPLI